MNYPYDIRLIALDLDGTVFNDKKEITPAVRSAIIAALEKGVIVMPATGRPEAGLPEAFLEIPGVTYALTSNGARIINIHTHEAVYKDTMPLPLALSIVDYLAEKGYVPDVYIDGSVFTEKEAFEHVLKTVDLGGLLPYFKKSRQPVENLRKFMETLGNDVEKINLMVPDPDIQNMIRNDLKHSSSIAIASGLPINLEITSATVNKGAALVRFGKQLGIRREQIMACGDSGNDLDMIREAGLGIAMENASKEAKAVSDYITKSNEEDGVAFAIQKFVLFS